MPLTNEIRGRLNRIFGPEEPPGPGPEVEPQRPGYRGQAIGDLVGGLAERAGANIGTWPAWAEWFNRPKPIPEELGRPRTALEAPGRRAELSRETARQFQAPPEPELPPTESLGRQLGRGLASTFVMPNPVETAAYGVLGFLPMESAASKAAGAAARRAAPTLGKLAKEEAGGVGRRVSKPQTLKAMEQLSKVGYLVGDPETAASVFPQQFRGAFLRKYADAFETKYRHDFERQAAEEQFYDYWNTKFRKKIEDRLTKPSPKVEAPAAQVKQPWEMTNAEWTQSLRQARQAAMDKGDYGLADRITRDFINLSYGEDMGRLGSVNAGHRFAVKAALTKGKPVPPEVLADYPELAQAQARESFRKRVQADIASRPETVSEPTELQRRQALPPPPQPTLSRSEARKVARMTDAELAAYNAAKAAPVPRPAAPPAEAVAPKAAEVPPKVAPQPVEPLAPPPPAAQAGAEVPPARPGPDILEGVITPEGVPPTRPSPAEGVPPGAGGGVPPAGPVTPATLPAPGSPLSRIQKMLETKPDKARDWGELALKTQEYINDSYYGLRRLQGQVAKRLPIQSGSREDIITAITRAPGAANAGLARYDLTVAQMKKLAPGANITDINTVLFAEHGKEILAAKGPARVLPGGVNTPAALDEALGQLRAKLGEEQYQKVYAAAQVVKDIYAAERQRLVQSGLISQELGDALARQYPWYNPLRYLDYVEKEAGRGRTVKPLTVTSSGLRRLSEVGSEEAILDPMAALSQELIRNEVRIQKNELAKGIINLGLKDPQLAITKRKITVPVAQVEGEPVFRAQHGEIPGTLSYFENGKRQVYDVPEWMYRETVVLNETIANPVASIVGAMNGISRAAFTTVSPVFTVANMANDMLPALMRGGVLPTSTARRLALSFKSLESDPLMQAYRLSGAYQGRFYGKDAAEIAKQAGASGGKVIGKNFDFKKAVFDAIPNLGEKGEQASRQAVFEKNLSKTLPGWRGMTPEAIAASPEGKKAAADAVEATINFGRGGYLIRSANPFVIFLNASMEGTKLPFRTLRDNPRSRWVLAGLGAGTVGLSAYNMSYPEYFDVPDRVRWGSVMIMLPSQKADINGKPIPRYVTIIPNTREWATFFAPLTYGLEKAYKDSPEEFGQFAWAMVPQVSPVSQIPLPPILEEAAQQAANYDFYRGTPIVSQGKQNLPPTEQTGPYVSPAVEKVAQGAGLSPLRVQHGLDALFGGAGQAVTSTIDLAVGAKNKQGLALKARYDAVPQAQKQEWLAKLSAADKSALQAALGQAQQTIPVASSLAGRFYRERGGQQIQNEYNQLDKAVEETNQQFAAETKVNTLGLQLGRVGASIDLNPGEKGGSIDLTPAQQAAFQRIMAETVTPVIKTYLGRLDRNLPVEKQKELVQTNIGGLKDWARARFLNENWPSPEATVEVKAFERKWATGTLAEAQETLRPYWELKDTIKEAVIAKYPDFANVLDSIKWYEAHAAEGQNRQKATALRARQPYKVYKATLEKYQNDLRSKDKNVEGALLQWGYVTVPIQEKLRENRPSLLRR